MIKYIKDFENVNGNMQYAKMQEEIQEAAFEYQKGDKGTELQELCDVVQTVYSRFQQMGLRKEDIQKEMDKHYKKETLRGRTVVEIEGKDYKGYTINQLLKTIAFMDREREENLREIGVLNRRVELQEKIIKANKEG